MRKHAQLALFVSLVAALLGFAGQAHAHDGALGDGGPFTVRIDTPATLPNGIEARWGNGEVEFHVPTGVEMIAYGFENEPMARVDKDGNMFANTLSPTWRMNQSDAMDMSGGDSSNEPVWEWVQGGGSLQYHEHRVHFMAAGVSPEIANGGDVALFTLDFSVNNTPLTISGALVFDPSLEPATAATLVAAGAAGTASNEHEHAHDETGTSGALLVGVGVGGALIGFGIMFIVFRRSPPKPR
jgi:hypothetical protein